MELFIKSTNYEVSHFIISSVPLLSFSLLGPTVLVGNQLQSRLLSLELF
jgi:hypothetical protein